MGIKIVRASENDIQIIRQLAFAIWPATYKSILSADQIAYMLDKMYKEAALKSQFQDNHKFLIAYRSNKPVAFAGYSQKENQKWYLNKIYVLEEEKGKGIGKMLIEYIIAELKANNFHCLVLNVNRYNKAKEFYEHLGFKVISEEDIPIGNGYYMNDYVLEKCW